MIPGPATADVHMGGVQSTESPATAGNAFSATARSTAHSIIVRSVAIALVLIGYLPSERFVAIYTTRAKPHRTRGLKSCGFGRA